MARVPADLWALSHESSNQSTPETEHSFASEKQTTPTSAPWAQPESESFTTADQALNRREAIRLLLSRLSAAVGTLGLAQMSSSDFGKSLKSALTASISSNRPPVAGFWYVPLYVNPYDGQEIRFFADSIDADGDGLTFEWHVDDDLRSARRNFSTKLPVGSHRVKLLALDETTRDWAEQEINVEPDQLFPTRNLRIPIKGINYFIGAHHNRGWFAPPTDSEMEDHLDMIQSELGCNAIKLVGDYEEIMLNCAEKAVARGFESIILSLRNFGRSPYEDITIEEHIEKVINFSGRAEELRLTSDAIMVCIGEELEISVRGIGKSPTYEERIEELYGDWTKWERTIRAYVEDRLNFHLQKTVPGVREKFQGKVTYSPSDATRLLVRWNELGFDVVGPMVYYDKKSNTRQSMLSNLAELKRFRRPVYVTEFGCATYRGASLWGGGGWQHYDGQPYSEEEQAESIAEQVDILNAAGADAIFLHTLVEYDENMFGILRYHGQPRARRKLGFYRYKSLAHA